VAYDEDLADRIRELLGPIRGLDEKRMFGGVAFLINGNMAVAVSRQGGLLARVVPGDAEALLARRHVSPMMMAGREVRGWLHVEPEGVKTKRQLAAWVTRCVEYTQSLPGK